VILLLRFIGVVNAAVWFGAAIFFTFVVAPAFFTTEMKTLLGDAYSGLVAQMVLHRYFILNYWCTGIGLVHFLAEWVYLGRSLQRWLLGLLITMLTFSLIGGLWLQPKLRRLHQIKYGRAELFTSEQRAEATRLFRIWHGVSQVINLLMLGGLGVYYWRTVHASDTARFVSTNKFRS
jgi:hypothetical protein